MRFALLFAASLTVACGARTELAGELVDASTPEVSKDVGVADHHDASIVDAGCTVVLSVATVTPSPASCWIDQKVSNETTKLEWDCDSGAAEADFDVPFMGTVMNGNVAISATTTFAWGDGCTWESKQSIAGALSTKTLTYSYSEDPVGGTNCAPAYCKATTPVTVE